MAVLGGGLMGSGIATALCLAGVEVILKEVNQGFLDAGMGRIKANLASRVGGGGGGEERGAGGRMRLAALRKALSVLAGCGAVASAAAGG